MHVSSSAAGLCWNAVKAKLLQGIRTIIVHVLRYITTCPHVLAAPTPRGRSATTASLPDMLRDGLAERPLAFSEFYIRLFLFSKTSTA